MGKRGVLLGLCLVGTAPPIAVAQAADSPATTLPKLVSDLPTGTSVRLTSGGSRWTGKVSVRSPDSLELTNEAGARRLRVAAIDSLWVQDRRSHTGLLAGAGFGALMFGVLQLGKGSSEDPGLNTSLGLAIFAGALAAGIAVDAVSDPWVQRYPRR
jgi:hypothetical protein